MLNLDEAFQSWRIGNFFIYFDQNCTPLVLNVENKRIIIICDGFLLPRQKVFENFEKYKNEQLIFELYNRYELAFINYVKGNFSIILSIDEKIFIYNDHLGIKKVFFINRDGQILISNTLSNVVPGSMKQINPRGIAYITLFHHFIQGNTFLSDVKYTLGASTIELGDVFKLTYYWSKTALISQDKKDNIYEFVESFCKIVRSYFDYFHSDSILLSLTGGFDSRLLLAVLLYSDLHPEIYCYGHPSSSDVIISNKIANSFNLKWNNYFNLDNIEEWYSWVYKKILIDGDSISQVQRAHRVFPIIRESEKLSGSVIIGGYMGGEGIRGLSYNDYYSSSILYDIWERQMPFTETVKKIMEEYYIKSYDIHNLVEELELLSFFTNQDNKINKFNFIYDVIAPLHHSTDINFLNQYSLIGFSPYLDIDYLEQLFRLKYNMLREYRNSFDKKLKEPYLYCKAIEYLFPKLLNFELSNGYSPSNYLHDKYSFLMLKIWNKIKRKRYTCNFAYDDWFANLLIEKSKELQKNTYLVNILDMDRYLYDLNHLKHQNSEGYWHKYINPIIINDLYKYYSKG